MSEGVMKSYAKELYEKEVVVKVAYAFTDRAYIHLDVRGENYLVSLVPKGEEQEGRLYAEFENELIAQETRRMVSERTKHIREMIVARALSSTMIDLKDEGADEEENLFDADAILTDWYEEYEK